MENRLGDNLSSYVYEKVKKVEKAKELIRRTTEKKNNPLCCLRMAELLLNKNPEAARKHLDTAFVYWAKADEKYIPFKRQKSWKLG